MPKTKKTEETTLENKTTVAEKPKKETMKKEPVKQTKTVKEAEIATAKPTDQKPKTNDKKLTLDVYDLEGKVTGSITLPEAIFGGKINQTLLAQAVRVRLANERQGTASTKTRGEVDGSTRKIYRQKGTGRARHGSVRAPIFVHGGIVFGPKPRDYSLKLPKKMKKAALISALTAKLQDNSIKILDGLEKIEPKTKKFVQTIEKLGLKEKKTKVLLITETDLDNVKRAGQNVQGICITAAQRINAYDVLNNKHLLITKQAIEGIKKHFLKGEKNA